MTCNVHVPRIPCSKCRADTVCHQSQFAKSKKLSDNFACFKVYFISPPPKTYVPRRSLPPLATLAPLEPRSRRGTSSQSARTIPARQPNTAAKLPRKPRVGDEQGLLIGGHTHHQSAQTLNIPGQLSNPLCQGSCPQTARVSAPRPARVRSSSQASGR